MKVWQAQTERGLTHTEVNEQAGRSEKRSLERCSERRSKSNRHCARLQPRQAIHHCTGMLLRACFQHRVPEVRGKSLLLGVGRGGGGSPVKKGLGHCRKHRPSWTVVFVRVTPSLSKTPQTFLEKGISASSWMSFTKTKTRTRILKWNGHHFILWCENKPHVGFCTSSGSQDYESLDFDGSLRLAVTSSACPGRFHEHRLRPIFTFQKGKDDI